MLNWRPQKWFLFPFLGVGLMLLSSMTFANSSIPITPLILIKADQVSGPPNLHPSGLSHCRNELLMISDRYPQTIFKLVETNEGLKAKTFLQLTYIEIPKTTFITTLVSRMFSFMGKRFDWEGISCDNKGNIYLGSERWQKILKVHPNERFEWLDIPIAELGLSIGLFQHRNAKLEGIAWLPGNEVVVVGERWPRGVMYFRPKQSRWLLYKAHLPEDSSFPEHNTSNDLTDVLYDQGKIYTLERSASIICRRSLTELKMERCWSFAKIAAKPEYQYDTMRPGLGEGLAIHQNHLMVIYDNNNNPRMQDAKDKRSTLFWFKIPSNWTE